MKSFNTFLILTWISPAYAKVFWSISALSAIDVVIPVVFIPKNWFIVLSEYVQTPDEPFSYKKDNVPEFGNPKVESTSMYVWATPTWPIIFVFTWGEKSPYIILVDPSGITWDPSRLIL